MQHISTQAHSLMLGASIVIFLIVGLFILIEVVKREDVR